MPMLTTVRMGLPVAPSQLPERKPSEKTRIFSRTVLTAGMTSDPSISMGVFERLRRATWSTARSSVQLMARPEYIFLTASSTPAAEASPQSSLMVSLVIRFFEKSKSIGPSSREKSSYR